MCYDKKQEVIQMEEQNIHEEQKESYQPRPAWQVWLARIGVVLMLVGFVLYCWHIANGGI